MWFKEYQLAPPRLKSRVHILHVNMYPGVHIKNCEFLERSIIYSIHLKGKVNHFQIMWQHICGIVPTFLSLEAHQGTIISYVTAI